MNGQALPDERVRARFWSAYLLAVAIVLLTIVSCAVQQQGKQPAGFNAYADGLARAATAVADATSLALNAHKISVSNAESILLAVEAARDGIQEARKIKAQQGDEAGTSRLRAVAAALDELAKYLEAPEARPPALPTTESSNGRPRYLTSGLDAGSPGDASLGGFSRAGRLW